MSGNRLSVCVALASFALLINIPKGLAKPFAYRDGSARLEQILDAQFSDTEPGAAIMVVHRGSVVFEKSYGVANLETGDAIDEHTQFYVASIGKTFTATAILLLFERGSLKLESPIGDFFPDFTASTRDIRVHHLLNHTSGLPNSIGDHEAQRTNSTIVQFVRDLEALDFDPGVGYQYSNVAYVLLAEIIEITSRQSYSDFVVNNILEPLAMSETIVYDESRPTLSNRAVGYTRHGEIYQVDDYRNRVTTGPGGIYSTLHDLRIWHEAITGNRILSRSSWELTFHMPYTLDGRRSWLAMGWFNETFGPKTPDLAGMKAFGAIGVLHGFRAIIKIFPEHDLSYIILSNSGRLPVSGSDVARIYLTTEQK